MSDCCSSSCCTAASPKKYKCPVNGIECVEVSAKTIIHHIKNPWQWTEKKQGYYFCKDPDCDVVYFGEDGSVIPKSAVRTVIGIKDKSSDSLACYCFGVSKTEAISNPSIEDYVTQNTRVGLCSCETSNPSGRCCLKDFPRDKKL